MAMNNMIEINTARLLGYVFFPANDSRARASWKTEMQTTTERAEADRYIQDSL